MKKEDRLARQDELTGFHNRLYFQENYGDTALFMTMRYKSVAVIDVDHYIEACSVQDRDIVIKRVAAWIRDRFGEKCEVFRWGENSFFVLMEWSMGFGTEICRELCEKVEQDGMVTVSVGITEVRLTETIKKHYHRAMQGCYLVKEMGGNGVKRV
ncbi:MAG: diguanylate cyclase [Lachnospiraceae bacterium]|nr:diguanylate cyclase [Lachnospiraceae bacterium]